MNNNFDFYEIFTDRDLIGSKHFNKKIDVTDPCYNKEDLCCRITVNAVEGTYACYARSTYTCYAREGNGKIVASAIVNDDVVDDLDSLEFKYLTDIGVDSGMAGYFNNKPDYTQKEWIKFCDLLNRNNESNSGTYLLSEKGTVNIDGFFTDSGGRDGYYSVYIAKKNDEIVAVAILYYD